MDDTDREAEIDASIEARRPTLTQTHVYDWEKHRAEVTALEAEAARWHTQYMRATGQLAALRNALVQISQLYPGTSVAGENAVRLAKAALEVM